MSMHDMLGSMDVDFGDEYDRVLDMTEGNPGAATALGELVASQDDASELLDALESNDVTGPYIWVGFSDHCDGDVEAFAQKIRDEDDAMYEEIEEYRELRGEA